MNKALIFYIQPIDIVVNYFVSEITHYKSMSQHISILNYIIRTYCCLNSLFVCAKNALSYFVSLCGNTSRFRKMQITFVPIFCCWQRYSWLARMVLQALVEVQIFRYFVFLTVFHEDLVIFRLPALQSACLDWAVKNYKKIVYCVLRFWSKLFEFHIFYKVYWNALIDFHY